MDFKNSNLKISKRQIWQIVVMSMLHIEQTYNTLWFCPINVHVYIDITTCTHAGTQEKRNKRMF